MDSSPGYVTPYDWLRSETAAKGRFLCLLRLIFRWIPITRKIILTNIMFIAAGGATGALLRYWVSNSVYALFGKAFPYGTLSVNITGSLLMGLCYVLLLERLDAGVQWRAFVMVGLLGAFTTFSTFSIETLNLIESGEQIRAIVNILLSVTLCIIGCWAGMIIGREI